MTQSRVAMAWSRPQAQRPPYFSLSMRIALSPFSPRGTGAEILAGN